MHKLSSTSTNFIEGSLSNSSSKDLTVSYNIWLNYVLFFLEEADKISSIFYAIEKHVPIIPEFPVLEHTISSCWTEGNIIYFLLN